MEYWGQGFELWIALALFAALIAHARHVVAVANFLPSTVADCFISLYSLHCRMSCMLEINVKFFALSVFHTSVPSCLHCSDGFVLILIVLY